MDLTVIDDGDEGNHNVTGRVFVFDTLCSKEGTHLFSTVYQKVLTLSLEKSIEQYHQRSSGIPDQVSIPY